MSIVDDIIAIAGRLFGLKRGPKIKRLPDPKTGGVKFPHHVPAHNSVESYVAGLGRCYYCYARQGSEEFKAPCPRRRPVELA